MDRNMDSQKAQCLWWLITGKGIKTPQITCKIQHIQFMTKYCKRPDKMLEQKYCGIKVWLRQLADESQQTVVLCVRVGKAYTQQKKLAVNTTDITSVSTARPPHPASPRNSAFPLPLLQVVSSSVPRACFILLNGWICLLYADLASFKTKLDLCTSCRIVHHHKPKHAS